MKQTHHHTDEQRRRGDQDKAQIDRTSSAVAEKGLWQHNKRASCHAPGGCRQ